MMSAFGRRRFPAIFVAVLVGLTGSPDVRLARAQSVPSVEQGQSSSVAFPRAANQGAAKWIEQSTFVASSIESGRIGYIEAWGGDDFGYSYSYKLSGEPKGLSVDGDTGILSVDTPLKAGTYQFTVAVTSHQTADKTARFRLTLKVKKGVTENRAADQILSKVYYVDSGHFGQPVGQDFTEVLSSIHSAIVKDQIVAGDGNLRATIYFRRGKRYDYRENNWPAGIQYLTVAPDPNVDPSGPRPQLRNVRKQFVFDSELAILGTGAGGAFDRISGEVKSNSLQIDAAEPGQAWVELKNVGDLAKLVIGRWYLVGSYDQQVGGYPPNIRYFDFAKVIGVQGLRVTLDRKLRHRHRDNFFEDPSEPNSLGIARIVPLDMGGAGGQLPDVQNRFTIRVTFKDIEFLKNPSTENGSNAVIYIDEALDASFENCIMPKPVPSIVEHMRFLGGVMDGSEPDKLISVLILDKVEATGEIGGATGVDYLFIRDSKIVPIQVSPRQLRVMNTSIDATTNTHLWYPVTLAYNGPLLKAEFEATRFTSNPNNQDTRVMPAIQRATARIGSDVHWRDGTLIIPRTIPNFLDWAAWLFEGAIISDDNKPGSWGIVQKLSAADDGSAIWASIEWTSGTRPSSGTLSFPRGYSIRVDDKSTLEGHSTWESRGSGFVKEKVPASFNVTDRPDDSEYPPLTSRSE
jgi:hypothetical protein